MILDVEAIKEDSFNSISEPIVVEERDYSLPNVDTLSREVTGLDLKQFSQFLCNEFQDSFEGTLPSEYVPVIMISGIECKEKSKIYGLFVQLNIFTKESFLNFILEYRKYEEEFSKRGRSIDNIGNILGRNTRDYWNKESSKIRLADRRTEGIVRDISAISSFEYSIYPSIIDGITFSEVTSIRIAETKGVLTPLRFKEREKNDLTQYDFSLRMFKWMSRVIHEVASNRGESKFFAANTISPAGVNFFIKKGGYLLPEEFDICYPDLRRICPATTPDSQRETTYTYKFEM
ncbi:MAG: hypothetical protein HGA25_09365 [Clostridiales bacterium]|nr:hypothetical protein [Clostridiales bacterium]